MAKFKTILAIFLFAFLVRVILLSQFPIGTTHDELNYAMAAKSLAAGFGFVPGTAPAILSTQMQNFNVVIAEVPALTMAGFELIGIGPRAVGAFLSSASVVVFYFLALVLLKKKIPAALAALIMAISPWSFLMGRTAFETNFLVFFFLLGLLMLFKMKNIYYSLVPFILGFFSYTGGQVSFYLFILLALFFKYKRTKKPQKSYLLYFLITTAVFFFYVLTALSNQSFASRGGELYLPNSPVIAKQVDEQRLISTPTHLNKLFINKATVYAKGLVEKYLKAFDVNTLFINGEFRAAFSLQQHGNFYFLDFVFLIIGISYLYSKDKRLWAFVLAWIAIAPLTSAQSTIEYSYTQRAALMYPFLILLVSLGMYCAVVQAKTKGLRLAVIAGLVVVYALLFSNMLYLYFFRVPVYASEGWFFQDRVLSNYIQRDNKKTIVVTFEPKIIFEEYLYYSGQYTHDNIAQINSNLDQKKYEFGNIVFSGDCPQETDDLLIVDPLTRCHPDIANPLRITRFKDVYENYLIYNDTLCKDFELSNYVSPEAFKNFSVEKQTPQKFCQSWVTKL